MAGFAGKKAQKWLWRFEIDFSFEGQSFFIGLWRFQNDYALEGIYGLYGVRAY